jgi:hypothetical protein
MPLARPRRATARPVVPGRAAAAWRTSPPRPPRRRSGEAPSRAFRKGPSSRIRPTRACPRRRMGRPGWASGRPGRSMLRLVWSRAPAQRARWLARPPAFLARQPRPAWVALERWLWAARLGPVRRRRRLPRAWASRGSSCQRALATCPPVVPNPGRCVRPFLLRAASGLRVVALQGSAGCPQGERSRERPLAHRWSPVARRLRILALRWVGRRRAWESVRDRVATDRIRRGARPGGAIAASRRGIERNHVHPAPRHAGRIGPLEVRRRIQGLREKEEKDGDGERRPLVVAAQPS